MEEVRPSPNGESLLIKDLHEAVAKTREYFIESSVLNQKSRDQIQRSAELVKRSRELLNSNPTPVASLTGVLVNAPPSRTLAVFSVAVRCGNAARSVSFTAASASNGD